MTEAATVVALVCVCVALAAFEMQLEALAWTLLAVTVIALLVVAG